MNRVGAIGAELNSYSPRVRRRIKALLLNTIGDAPHFVDSNARRTLCSQLLHYIRGSHIRHQQGRYKDRQNHGFGPVECNIAGYSGDRQDERKYAFERNLQKFYQSGHSESHRQSRKFRTERDPAVAKERITQRRIHAPI
jgi:hypothetical protein